MSAMYAASNARNRRYFWWIGKMNSVGRAMMMGGKKEPGAFASAKISISRMKIISTISKIKHKAVTNR